MPSIKVAHRLLIGFLVLVVLICGIVWLSTATGTWQENRLTELREAALEATDHATGMAMAARSAHSAAQALRVQRIAATNATEVDDAARRSQERAARATIDDAFSTFDRHLARSREIGQREGRSTAERLSALEDAYTTYKQASSRFLELPASPEEGLVAVSSVFETQLQPHFDETLAPLLARHVSATQTALLERIDAAEAARIWSARFLFGALGLLLIVLIGMAFVNTRYVDTGLRRAIAASRAIAAGRLTNPIRVSSDDEFGDLTEAFNEMVARLSTATVSKTYVDNIVQSMADPLIVVDPDVRIAMVNQALLDLLGYESDELTGASVTRIFAHTGRQRGAAIKQDIERGLAGNVDSKFRTKAGQEVVISLSSALVRASGEVQGLVIVAKDITEQKRREKELIDAKEAAERMVQLRDAFLANMSHEIRTPLTGILGSAQVLAEVVEGEHKNLARIIEDAGNRLLDTINSVLEMARIEAGEVQPEMEILDFAQEAEAVANVLRPVAKKKGLVLRVYPPADSRVAAQLDRSCLNRILNNLVGNAIKFTREGAVSIEISADEDSAVLTVRDTGIGISKEFLPYLFDDFKQESTGLRRSHEGSGLGLAITKKLIDMMGGSVEVESVKGLGSAFTVRFDRVPLEEAAAAQSRLGPTASADGVAPWEAEHNVVSPTFEPPPPASQRPGRDLLLIEDNEQNAYMAKFMLEGFAADVATSPDEALALALRHQYGVLLVDINLGTDSSGIDLLHEIRQIEGYSDTPAVAVTAYALPGDRERFLSEGFDDYVSKPYRKETLREAVERALASREPIDPGTDLDMVLGGSFDEPSEAQPEDEVGPEPEFAAPPQPVAPEPQGQLDDVPPAEPIVVQPRELSDYPADVQAAGDPVRDAAKEAYSATPLPPASPLPTASPDEFLPPTYRPDVTAFPPEVARLVEEAAAERAAQRQQGDRASIKRASDEAGNDLSAHPNGDAFHFVDVDPQDSSGDGVGRPPEPSGG